MDKRIFIAVPATQRFRNQANKFSADLGALPIRWLESKNLHITLVPPFHFEDKDWTVEEVEAMLKKISGFKPFEVHFDTVEFGPNKNTLRLVWAKGKAPTELSQLKEEIDKAVGWEPDRPFTMHITLARFQEHHFNPDWHQILPRQVRWTMLVDNFAIMESVRNHVGSDYEVLKTFNLYDEIAVSN